MPELPEVETIVRELNAAHLVEKKIEDAYIYWKKIVDTSTAEEFIQQIRKQSIKKITRRGKYLVFTLTQDTLLVHLRMTGRFEIVQKNTPVNKHEHVRLIFSDGTVLRYEDPRKFGRWSLFHDASEKINTLGLEPLSKEFSVEALKKLLNNRPTPIKAFLLNQKFIAGMGNIYVDEALWKAKIHPQTPAKSITGPEIRLLHHAIQDVLQAGIENLGTSLGTGKGNYYNVSGQRGGHQNHLNVFRKNNQKCSRCHSIILKIVLAQRGTHYCPTCQQIKV